MDRTLATDPPDDGPLVRRCLAGDRAAFHDLTPRHYRPVSAFVLRRGQRGDVVEDLVQETFLEAFRSLKVGKKPERFASWLFAIAHHCCGKWLRRRRPQGFAEGQADEIAAPAELPLAEELEEQAKRMAALE